jgi:hypothetical protein
MEGGAKSEHRKGPIQSIELSDSVIAEHGLATTTGSCIADKAHIEAMWLESAARTPAKTPVPKIDFTDAETVSARSLTEYEEFGVDSEQIDMIDMKVISQ